MRAMHLGWLLLTFAAGAPLAAEQPPTHVLCRQMLEGGGFDGRFEALRVLVRVAGCSLRGLVTEEAMRNRVAPRVQRYAWQCFDEQERLYLQESIRRGALQEAGRAELGSCSVALEAFVALPLVPASP